MFPSAICRLSVPLAASIFRAQHRRSGSPYRWPPLEQGPRRRWRPRKPGDPSRWAISSEGLFQRSMPQQRSARLQADVERRHSADPRRKMRTVVVDEFIYDPVMSRGGLSLRGRQRGVPIRRGSDRRGERGECADSHAGWSDRPAGHHSLGRPNRQGYGVVVLNGESP